MNKLVEALRKSFAEWDDEVGLGFLVKPHEWSDAHYQMTLLKDCAFQGYVAGYQLALSEHRAEPSRCGCCGAEIAKEADVCPSCNIVQWDNRAIADASSNTAFEPEPSADVVELEIKKALSGLHSLKGGKNSALYEHIACLGKAIAAMQKGE